MLQDVAVNAVMLEVGVVIQYLMTVIAVGTMDWDVIHFTLNAASPVIQLQPLHLPPAQSTQDPALSLQHGRLLYQGVRKFPGILNNHYAGGCITWTVLTNYTKITRRAQTSLADAYQFPMLILSLDQTRFYSSLKICINECSTSIRTCYNYYCFFQLICSSNKTQIASKL